MCVRSWGGVREENNQEHDKYFSQKNRLVAMRVVQEQNSIEVISVSHLTSNADVFFISPFGALLRCVVGS